MHKHPADQLYLPYARRDANPRIRSAADHHNTMMPVPGLQPPRAEHPLTAYDAPAAVVAARGYLVEHVAGGTAAHLQSGLRDLDAHNDFTLSQMLALKVLAQPVPIKLAQIATLCPQVRSLRHWRKPSGSQAAQL